MLFIQERWLFSIGIHRITSNPRSFIRRKFNLKREWDFIWIEKMLCTRKGSLEGSPSYQFTFMSSAMIGIVEGTQAWKLVFLPSPDCWHSVLRSFKICLMIHEIDDTLFKAAIVEAFAYFLTLFFLPRCAGISFSFTRRSCFKPFYSTLLIALATIGFLINKTELTRERAWAKHW